MLTWRIRRSCFEQTRGGMDQRRQVRYQSKAVHYGIPVLILAMAVYTFHVLLLAGPFVAWFDPGIWVPLSGIAAAKIAVDAIFLERSNARFGRPVSRLWLPVLELVLLPYVTIVCALAVFLPRRWN